MALRSDKDRSEQIKVYSSSLSTVDFRSIPTKWDQKTKWCCPETADLGTEANGAGQEKIAAVIFLVKGDAQHLENIKPLKTSAGAKQGALERTYAYLIGKKVED